MIKVENLTKNYDELVAVNKINFEVNEGEILGFLGPNGAGKSTTLRMLTSYLLPTSGNIYFDNKRITKFSKEEKKLIGFMPENNPLYEEMLVYDYLKFVSDLREIKNFKFAFDRVVELCGLKDVVAKNIGELSKGYRQRVGLAQAIIHDPKILILDEPTSGLDPNQIIEIRNLIKNLGKEKTLILSSHIMQEVQALCDRIIVLNKGKLVADGSVAEIKASVKGKDSLSLSLIDEKNEIDELENKVSDIKIASKKENNKQIDLEIDIPKDADKVKEIYAFIKNSDIVMLEMYKKQISLEDVFTQLTTEKGGK